jgi:hypothetical protein
MASLAQVDHKAAQMRENLNQYKEESARVRRLFFVSGYVLGCSLHIDRFSGKSRGGCLCHVAYGYIPDGDVFIEREYYLSAEAY